MKEHVKSQKPGTSGPTQKITPKNKTVKTKPGSCPHESKGAK